MIRASDLIDCVVRTESGRKIGRVHDLRRTDVDGELRLVGLVTGWGAMLAQLTGANATAEDRGDVIPWETITRIEDGHITVRDQPR